MNVNLEQASEVARQQQSEEIALLVENIAVQTEEQYQGAASALIEVKSRLKSIDEQRKSFTSPLNKVVKEINAFFKVPLDQYRAAEAALKKAMAVYNAEVAAQRQKALQEAAAQAQTGDKKSFAEMMQVATANATPQAAGTHAVVRWKFEVTDASLIPRE